MPHCEPGVAERVCRRLAARLDKITEEVHLWARVERRPLGHGAATAKLERADRADPAERARVDDVRSAFVDVPE